MQNICDKLGQQLERFDVRRDCPLKEYTSFRTGGPADAVVCVRNAGELSEIIRLCASNGIPYYVLGNGTNCLASDDGYRGVIILTGEINHIEISSGEECIVTAGAGALLSRVASECLKNSLTGFEFAAGIPGSIGGAVVMNAGAYGGEMKDCLVSVEVIDRDGVMSTLSADELRLSYRYSVIPERELVVAGATLRFKKGDANVINTTMQELAARRREKQPLEYPSAGSTFKRPEGYFAGKLIEDAGLRGFTLGGAAVSDKHCGFIINKSGATSTDIENLILYVQDKVYEQAGVRLEPEVKRIR